MPTESFTEDDHKFLAAVETCSLPQTSWTHKAHLRLTWLLLEKIPTFEAALQRIKVWLQGYYSSTGSPGYHETITLAYAQLLQYRRLLDPTLSSCETFLANNADLLDPTHPALLNWRIENIIVSHAMFRAMPETCLNMPSALYWIPKTKAFKHQNTQQQETQCF